MLHVSELSMVMAIKRKMWKKSAIASDRIAAPGGPAARGSGRTIVASQSSTGLSVGELAAALRVPEEMIRGHVEKGAPTDNGRINPICYAAWLLCHVADEPADS